MLESGVALDEGMIYFDARLSHRYPTLEIRVADVCADVRDTVVVAALCRALVDTASRRWRSGEAPAQVPASLVRLATWHAGRFGLSHDLLDPVTMRPRPAREVIADLVDGLGDSLDQAGDRALVAEGVERAFERGTGADRQREIFEKTGRLSDVVAHIARVTAEQER
jgi:carboxylate-amine ligase